MVADLARYEGHGLSFSHPRGWEISEESNDDAITITVTSSGCSFFTLVVMDPPQDPEDVIEQIVETYREIYPEMDEYPHFIPAGAPGMHAARELDFVCLDVVTTVALHAFRTGERTLMTLVQGPDKELEDISPLLEAIAKSVQADDGIEQDHSASDE
ncbi:MAG: hypothetical protein C0478_00955 [Planctomyces sp.]|nr:hypothetical protein [Planctomyces sp.]